MAKVMEGFHIRGTFGNVTFYPLNGHTYVRTKSSLSRERVLKSASFEKTRKYASDLGRAARIGSFIYKALPAIKARWIYQTITGEAASLLYEGMQEQEVKDMLWKKYLEETGIGGEGLPGVSGPGGSSTCESNGAATASTMEAIDAGTGMPVREAAGTGTCVTSRRSTTYYSKKKSRKKFRKMLLERWHKQGKSLDEFGLLWGEKGFSLSSSF
jgi:hypothetical protein